MFQLDLSRIGLALRRRAGELRDAVRAVLAARRPEHLQGLWRRASALQPVREQSRRDADRS